MWRVERVALLIKHYPFSVSHCGHYWQALDLELERNLTGVPVITRLDSQCVFACVCVCVKEKMAWCLLNQRRLICGTYRAADTSACSFKLQMLFIRLS